MSEELIVTTPGVIGGVPRFAGTRIAVAMVRSLLEDGFTAEQITGLYPSVTAAHVKAAQEWTP